MGGKAMTDTMTPSEIAELKERLNATHIKFNMGYREERLINVDGPRAAYLIDHQAATIRELEARETRALAVAEHHADESMVLKAKLKIATEALERMISLYEGEHDPENLKRPQWLVDALSRIKEVG